jgi:REP element-mobilizing transposase RayT
LKDYDYTQAGGYFITVVTWKREHLFGEVANGEMVLNAFGKIVDECWESIPDHFPNVELGAYAIMPNHVHGIILINDNHDRRGTLGSRGTIYRAPTASAPTTEKFGKPVPGSIPTIIRTFKAAATRELGRKFDLAHIWQRNYYEHVIRDVDEANRIHLYIEANAANWADDKENLANHRM